MDLWTAIGVFFLGAGAGALTTAALYSSQIHRIKQLVEVASQQRAKEAQNQNSEAAQRKSA